MRTRPEKEVTPPANISSSSLDEAVMPLHHQRQIILNFFQDFTKRVADALQTPLEEVKDQILYTTSSSKIALPVNKALLDPAKLIWQTLAFISRTCKRADKKYYMPSKDVYFLFSHPSPNSIVVDAVNSHGKPHHAKSTSYDKYLKRFDLFGRKACSSATLQFRIANYQALLAKYNHTNYGKLHAFIGHLPDKESNFKPPSMRAS